MGDSEQYYIGLDVDEMFTSVPQADCQQFSDRQKSSNKPFEGIRMARDVNDVDTSVVMYYLLYCDSQILAR
jgi:hypothetical protein